VAYKFENQIQRCDTRYLDIGGATGRGNKSGTVATRRGTRTVRLRRSQDRSAHGVGGCRQGLSMLGVGEMWKNREKATLIFFCDFCTPHPSKKRNKCREQCRRCNERFFRWGKFPRNQVHRRRNDHSVLTLLLDTTLQGVFSTNVQDTTKNASDGQFGVPQFQM